MEYYTEESTLIALIALAFPPLCEVYSLGSKPEYDPSPYKPTINIETKHSSESESAPEIILHLFPSK